jgi:hypothetical protein
VFALVSGPVGTIDAQATFLGNVPPGSIVFHARSAERLLLAPVLTYSQARATSGWAR